MDRQSSNGTDNRGVQAFVALQILGAVLFVMITTTAFVAQRRGGSRHPTFFSFCFSWIVFCASYALLTFAGQQERPDHSMCTVHAALVYAAPPLAGSTTVSLVTHLLLNVHLALYKTAKKRGSLFVSIALVFTPWIIWISIVIGVLFFGFHYPDLVQFSSNRTYCILIKTSLPNLLSSWTTLFFAILIVEEIVIGVLLYRNRDLLRGYNQSATMTMRVMVLTIFARSGIAVAFVYTVTDKLGIQFDLLIGASE
ncbi:hypothetical protein H2248_011736 [Termitomyces sp. 'cryptogamus']|nr:hypothetical protein H2248_011736 [Termitomyces sp. 'cryptogamus']